MNEWRKFMAKYLPGADTADLYYFSTYGVGQTAEHVLKQCGGRRLLAREHHEEGD